MSETLKNLKRTLSSSSTSSSSSRVSTSSAKFLRMGFPTGISNKIINHAPKRVSILPAEVLDNIFQFLTQRELISLLPTNKCLYAISARQFYHTVSIHCAWRSVAFFQAALNNPSIPPLVRSLDIDISDSYPLKSFYRLFQKVLQRLPALVTLLVDFPKSHSPLWIFHDCIFSLKKFSTSMHCTLSLALFLDTQPNITHLTLRGFQNNNISVLPFLSAVPVSVATMEGQPFKLKPTSLPNLTHFNAIHAGSSVIQAVVEHRPVEVVSIPLFPLFSMDSLSSLKHSSVPLKRLSLISFDPDAPKFLFQVLSDGFVHLEALHVVFLMTDYTKVCQWLTTSFFFFFLLSAHHAPSFSRKQELLEQSGSLLRHFKSLKVFFLFICCFPPCLSIS